MEMPESELYSRACEHGWTFACGKTLHASPKLITNPKPPIASPAVATRTWPGYLIVATIIASVALLLYLRGHAARRLERSVTSAEPAASRN